MNKIKKQKITQNLNYLKICRNCILKCENIISKIQPNNYFKYEKCERVFKRSSWDGSIYCNCWVCNEKDRYLIHQNQLECTKKMLYRFRIFLLCLSKTKYGSITCVILKYVPCFIFSSKKYVIQLIQIRNNHIYKSILNKLKHIYKQYDTKKHNQLIKLSYQRFTPIEHKIGRTILYPLFKT